MPTGFAAGRAAAVKAARRGVTVPANASFDALIDAAAAGATLGQLSAALAAGQPPAGGIVPIPPRRDAAPFEALRARVAALRATDPARGRVACACLGGLARTLPRLDFTRGFFGVAGFEVIEGSFADTAAEAARNAMAAGAATVVAVALDDVYAAAGADLLAALKHAPGVRRVMVAGQPQDQVAALTAAGADGFIHLRSDLLAVLGDLVTHLEETR